MITLVLECVDRLNVYNTAAHFSEYAGEEAAESWKEIVNLLYELLGRPLFYAFSKYFTPTFVVVVCKCVNLECFSYFIKRL